VRDVVDEGEVAVSVVLDERDRLRGVPLLLAT
jgi:hypothetical protein